MKIDNIGLHAFLTGRGITHLHHANSVASSISFIESGGLLSRGYIERNGLFQTAQKSDNDDRKFDVWDDVFFDTADLHGLFPRQNLYGPILFIFNIDLLLDNEIDIWITKNNPMYWSADLSDHDKYFQGTNDLINHWDDFDTQRKMITIRKPSNPISFRHLEKIIVDDPQVYIYEVIMLFNEAKAALYRCTENNQNLRNIMTIRECKTKCYCKGNYLNEIAPEQLARLFLPRYHKNFPD